MASRQRATLTAVIAFAAAGLLAVVAPAAMAAEPDRPITPTGADTPEGQALRRVLTRYLTLENYRDSFDSERSVLVVTEEGEPILRDQSSVSGTLAVARPDRLAVALGEGGGVLTDGRRVWFHRPELKQYRETELGDIERLVPFVPAMTDVAHPALLALSGVELEDVLARMEVTSYTPAEPPQRQARLEGRVEALLEGLPAGAPMSFSATFDEETALLSELTVDVSAPLSQALAENLARRGIRASVQEARLSLRFAGIAADQAVPADTFTFRPPEDYQEVERFGAQAQQPDGGAPDFTGTTLQGEQLSLADLRGNVVVLDFWATWCGPCRQALPHIEELAREFAGRPVRVIGVNLDGPDAESQVRALVEQEELTFTQLLDSEQAIARSYNVRAIPHIVVIDATGAVRHAQDGFNPETKDELRALIEQLLAGAR